MRILSLVSRGYIAAIILIIILRLSYVTLETPSTRYALIFALNNGMGGEIFVPKLKSFKVTDLAKALDSSCKFNITGIRPGEKLHEELITKAESYSCFDLNKYFIILQENFKKRYEKSIINKKIKFPYSYNSEENIFLTIKEIKYILSRFSINF